MSIEDGFDTYPKGEILIRDGKTYYVGWMKCKDGEDDLCMWINEQPTGGFKWNFLDYEPEDKENYRKIYILAEEPQ